MLLPKCCTNIVKFVQIVFILEIPICASNSYNCVTMKWNIRYISVCRKMSTRKTKFDVAVCRNIRINSFYICISVALNF